MVLSVDHEANKVIATIRNETGTEQYECIISACENPVCTCGSVYLEFIPSPMENEDGRTLHPHRVSIDIDDRKLEHKGRVELQWTI
jgi:hypothetical protein